MGRKSIFEPRRYLHFDEPVSEAASKRLATNPALVQSWSFFPFLQFRITTRRVHKNSEGEPLPRKPKQRLIAYAAHKDAAIYSWYGHLLSGSYEALLQEAELQDFVNAFRPGLGKCNVHFAKEAFDHIRNTGPCVALAFDIEGFFDNLDHAFLKRAWTRMLSVDRLPSDHYAVFRSLTRYAFVERDAVYKELGVSRHNPRAGHRRRLCSPEEFRTRVREKGLIQTHRDTKGIPQGSPMSAILSNIYLFEFDRLVSAAIKKVGGLYRRYCDDILVVVTIEDAKKIEDLVMAEIAKTHLTIQTAKTKSHIFKVKDGRFCADKPLQYLGFRFDGQRAFLRTVSLTRFYNKMRAAVKSAGAGKRKFNRQAIQKGHASRRLARKKLLSRFSHLGHQNFPSYAFRAADIMGEVAIRHQLKPHWKKLHIEMEKQDFNPEGIG